MTVAKTLHTWQRVRTCRVAAGGAAGSGQTCRGNTLANCYCQCLNYFALSLPLA